MASDSFYGNVVLLLHCKGAEGGGTFLDQSPYPSRWLTASSGAKTTTAKGKFGGSLQLDGSSYVGSNVASTDFAFGTGDFCIEMWVERQASATESILLCMRNAASGIFNNMVRVGPGGLLGWSNGVAWLNSSVAVPLGVWSFVAITRTSGTLRMFIDGQVALSTTDNTDIVGSRILRIGSYEAYDGNPDGGFFTGNICELRVTKGVSRYTSDFLPPTEEFEPLSLGSPKLGLVAATPRYVPGYNLEPQSPLRVLSAKGGAWLWETQTTGSGTISGVVTIENIPGSRKVRLYRKHDGMLLRETWSAPNGAYSFNNLDPAWEYFVVAHDHLRVYNGVIQDMLVP